MIISVSITIIAVMMMVRRNKDFFFPGVGARRKGEELKGSVCKCLLYPTLNLFPLRQRVNGRYYALWPSIFAGDRDIELVVLG